MLRLLSSLMEEIKDAGKKEESDMSSQQVQTASHLFFIKFSSTIYRFIFGFKVFFYFRWFGRSVEQLMEIVVTNLILFFELWLVEQMKNIRNLKVLSSPKVMYFLKEVIYMIETIMWLKIIAHLGSIYDYFFQKRSNGNWANWMDYFEPSECEIAADAKVRELLSPHLLLFLKYLLLTDRLAR